MEVRMKEPFKSFSAVFPIIIQSSGKTQKILLHRRQNTGYQDGKLDIAGSGHVDKGETAMEAVVRECREELGIEVKIENLTFAHLQHRLSYDRIYYDIYFIVNNFQGTPSIMEPEKCSELVWYDLDNLPNDIIECRKMVLKEYIKSSFYSERVE